MTKSIAKSSVAKYEKLWGEIQRVSHEALATATPPRPMIVGSPSTPLGNDVDPNQKQWFVADGVCGFAWVVIDSGRGGFAQWLLKNERGHKNYSWGGYKGVAIRDWARFGFADTRQSLQLKEQVAGAIARYLRSQGIACHVESRMD